MTRTLSTVPSPANINRIPTFVLQNPAARAGPRLTYTKPETVRRDGSNEVAWAFNESLLALLFTHHRFLAAAEGGIESSPAGKIFSGAKKISFKKPLENSLPSALNPLDRARNTWPGPAPGPGPASQILVWTGGGPSGPGWSVLDRPEILALPPANRASSGG